MFTLYEFGPYRLDPANRMVWRGKQDVRLTVKQFDLLHAIVRRQGSVAKNSELFEEVWPGDRSVSDVTLRRHVSDVRKILDRPEAGEEYIETRTSEGYRIRVPVKDLYYQESISTGAEATEDQDPPAAAPQNEPVREVVAPTSYAGAGGPTQSSQYRTYLRRAWPWLPLVVIVVLVATLGLRSWKSAQKNVHSAKARENHLTRLLSSATSEGGVLLSRQITFIPGALLVTPDERRIYAIEENGKAVVVLNAVDLTVEATLTLPSSAHRAVVSLDGKWIYAGSWVDGIIVIDTDTNQAEDLGIRTGGPVMDLDVTADGKKAYLAMGSRGLKEADLRNRELKSISEDISPQFVKIDPTGRQLFVSYQAGGPGGSKGHDALVTYDLRDNYKPYTLPPLRRVGGPIEFAHSYGRILLDEWDVCSTDAYIQKECPFVPSRIFHILSTNDFSVVKTLTLPASVRYGGFFRDGRQCVFGGEAILVYDIARQEIIERFSRIGESYGPLSFAPHGDRAYVFVPQTREILMFRSGVSRCSLPDTGLMNLYAGDGTLDDMVDTGAAQARGSVEFGPGVIGQAFHFGSEKNGFLEIDRTGTCVYCGNEWTISLFVKLASLQSEATILKRERAKPRFGYRLFKARDNRMVFEVDQGAEHSSSVTRAETLISGRWYSIELTSDGTSVGMFVDGVLAGRIALPEPDPLKTAWGTVYLGGTPDGTQLDGWIDEIAFYNRELSLKEIQSIPKVGRAIGLQCIADAPVH